MKYGMEGYGLYWHCIELITEDVSETNITFELEHDSEIIAHDTGINYQLVTEMVTFMVNLGLFEESSGVVTCYKIAKRLDQSMTSNPYMRDLIKKARGNHDGIMIESCKRREEKKRREKTKPTMSAKYTDEDMSVALIIKDMVARLNPSMKKPNEDGWANTVRLIREIDSKAHDEILELFSWANNNDFWKTNILSPSSLRKRWDQLTIKMNNPRGEYGQRDNRSKAKKVSDRLDELARAAAAKEGLA